MIDKNCRIAARKDLAEDIFRLDIHGPGIAAESDPGQFVMIEPSKGITPLLRRPFSVHTTKGEEIFSLLIEIKGEGTKRLSGKGEGDRLNVLGPLGKGFKLDDIKQNLYIAAGGVGIAPMKYAVDKAQTKGIDTTIFYGAKRAAKLIELPENNARTIIATEDGSRGTRALITEVFEDYLGENPQPVGTVLTCGPEDMMSEITRLCEIHGLAVQVSYEEKMACGFGLCLGCTCETTEGYKKSCLDGPVFDGKEILWT